MFPDTSRIQNLISLLFQPVTNNIMRGHFLPERESDDG